MKFRFYITTLLDGAIYGTNSSEIARNYSQSEDCFVVDTATNEFLLSDGTSKQIEEIS